MTDPTPEELDELARLLAQPKAGTLLDDKEAAKARAAGIPLRPHYASAAAKASGEPSAWYVLPDDVAERAFVDRVMAALPSLLATAEWAQKARGAVAAAQDAHRVLAAMLAEPYPGGPSLDQVKRSTERLGDALASLLAPDEPPTWSNSPSINPAAPEATTREGAYFAGSAPDEGPAKEAPLDLPPGAKPWRSGETEWLSLDEAASIDWTPSPMPTPEEPARMAAANLAARLYASVGENPWMVLVAPVAERVGATAIQWGHAWAYDDTGKLHVTDRQAIVLHTPGGAIEGHGATLDEAAADLCRKAPTGDAGGGDDGQ